MREHPITKANRYITEDRVEILEHTPNTITTRTTGDTGTWYTHSTPTGYTCTCPAQHTCSHIIATEALAQQANLQNTHTTNLV